MTSNVNRKLSLKQQKSLDSYFPDNCPKKGIRSRVGSLRHKKQCTNGENSTGMTTWGRNQLNRAWSYSLVDYTDPQRAVVVLDKQDNEGFGFEVQTYGLQLRHSGDVEMCTFVSSVQKDSAAETAGLTVGNIILTVNGVSIKGLNHECIVKLIQNSVNLLTMETVNGIVVKMIELEKKIRLLKQTLHEKWVELQALTLQEQRLTRGNLSVSSQHPSMDSLMSLSSPTCWYGQRLSSDSSCLSMVTDDSEDAAFQLSVFDDFSPSSPTRSNVFNFLQPDGAPPKRALFRTRSVSSSSGCQSPTYDNGKAYTFGTLPRSTRKNSMRKSLLKFIPGMNHSLEEEEAT